MLRKFTAGLLTIIMLVTFISISMPLDNVVYAAGTIKLKVTKDNAPIRNKKVEEGDEVRRVSKGTILTAQKKELNWKFRWWYKLKDGEYIYSGNVEETHDHKVVITGYETAHPHLAIHKCKHCYDGATCGPETKKVKGCEKCYPSSKETKKENTNKVPNTNVTTPADILVPKQPSLQEEAEKKLGTTETHKHNYKLSQYSSTHPHYAIYKCSCGDSYTEKSKTEMQSICTTCYPPHKHDYKLVGYSNTHPHIASYQCSCKAGYSDSKVTTKVKDCKQCYPYGYGNDHFCDMVYTGKNLKEHPHYAIDKCSICYKEKVNQERTKSSTECNVCNNPFNDKVENIPDFHGRIYDLSTGKIINVKEAYALYDYAKELHASLDILGLFPVVGEGFDFANAVYYIVEGDYVDAVLSGAAMFPIIGVLAKDGKIYKKMATVTIDLSTKIPKTVSEEITESIVRNNLKYITPVAKSIIADSKYHSETTLRIIKDITENKSIKFSEAFYKKQLLISRNYLGSVTTSSGLKYAYNPDEYKNAIYHIIDKHGYSKAKNKVAGVTYFNIDGREIMELVEDLYQNSNSIKTKVVTNKGITTRTSLIIDAGRVIGTEGEKKLLLVLEGNSVISAYPTNKIDFDN